MLNFHITILVWTTYWNQEITKTPCKSILYRLILSVTCDILKCSILITKVFEMGKVTENMHIDEVIIKILLKVIIKNK